MATTFVAKSKEGIVKLPRDKSGYFPDNSAIVRVNEIPWTPFNLVGSEQGSVFKLLSVLWNHDMYTMYLNVPGGLTVEPHYHLGEAHGYIFTGSFDYEYGDIYAGDYLAEGDNIAHNAQLGPDDVLQFSLIFGGLCGVLPDGGPDLSTNMGCMEVYNVAKAAGAADHILPPPPGWRSKYTG
jgi:hypothetical protein